MTAPTNKPSSIKLAAIPEIEGLRGLMALWVVLDHMANWAGYVALGNQQPNWYMNLLLKGGAAVEVFIAISGFVIFYLLDKDQEKIFRPYIIGRFFRLYPAYLLAILLALALSPLELSAQLTGQWHDPQFQDFITTRKASISEQLGIHTILHIFMLHGLIPDQILKFSGDAILGVAWSLSLEWQFYIVAPCLFILIKRSLILGVASCFAILLIKLLLLKSGLTFSYGGFLPIKFEFFCLGIASYFTYKKFCINPLSNRPIVILLAAIVFAFIIMAFTGGMREHSYSVGIWLLIFFAALLRIKGSHFLKPVSAVLMSKPLSFLGRISYSTYLIHPMVIWCCGTLIPIFFGESLVRSTAFLIMLGIGCSITLLASFLIHKYIEKPGIAFGKHFHAKT